jgi:hypothetical protein
MHQLNQLSTVAEAVDALHHQTHIITADGRGNW